jgi:hypothetical protein
VFFGITFIKSYLCYTLPKPEKDKDSAAALQAELKLS